MKNVQEMFIEQLISMNVIKKESVVHEGENWIIHDNVSLEYTYIKEIPDNITVRGNMNLSDTKHLEKIGNNVCIEGNLAVRESSLQKIGCNFKVWGDCELILCKEIKTLPLDMVVKGTLTIRDTESLKIPKGFHAANNITISECYTGGTLEDLTADGSMQIDYCDDLKEIRNINIGQNLKIIGCRLLSSISNLQVKRDISIFNSPINKSFKDISAGGNLIMRGTKINKLPDGFSVKGELDLYGSEIEYLPDELEIGGRLILYNCKKIKKLPEKLGLGGDLNLTNTEIERLPDSLTYIPGNLILNHSKVRYLPPNLTIEKNLEIIGCLVEEIPESIHVGGKIIKERKKISIHNNEQLRSFLLEELLVSQDKIKAEGEQLIVSSDLKLARYDIEVFNVNLVVNGNLDLGDIKEISGRITVHGNLNMGGSVVEKFDALVTVNGDMILHSSQIKNPPQKLTVGGDLDMGCIKNYGRLPEEINVKGHFKLFKYDQSLELPKKITVGKDALIEASSLKGLKEINVGGDLRFLFAVKKEVVACNITAGATIDLSYTEITGITGNITAGENVNLTGTSCLGKISTSVKAGKRLILRNSRLNTLKLEEAKKEGYLPDGTVIEGDIRFSRFGLNINKIGDNVKIYGNVEFDYLSIKEIGNNFTVYGNMSLEKTSVNSIGRGLTVYGDVRTEKSSIERIESANIQERLVMEESTIGLLNDINIGRYIYCIDSDIKTACGCKVYSYNDFIEQFKEHVGATKYFVHGEVEAYFSLDQAINRLIERLEESELTSKISQLESRSLHEAFLDVIHKVCNMADEDPDIWSRPFYKMVFKWEDGCIKCFMDQGEKYLSIDELYFDGYKEIKDEIRLMKDKKIQKDYALLLESMVYKVLIREFALMQMDEAMDEIEEWGDRYAEEMYEILCEERDEEDEDYLIQFDLALEFVLPQGSFVTILGGYDE